MNWIEWIAESRFARLADVQISGIHSYYTSNFWARSHTYQDSQSESSSSRSLDEQLVPRLLRRLSCCQCRSGLSWVSGKMHPSPGRYSDLTGSRPEA